MKKLALVITILISVFGNTSAQAPDTLWSRIHSISPNGDIDEGKCVRQTLDGGYIIAGSCIPDGLVSHADVLLLKTDASGNIQWTKTFERGFFEEGLSVEQTSDEGYIVGGRCLTGSYPFIDPPISDAWIMKTDINGDTLWTKTYGGNGNDYSTSIQQTPDLGYIITGTVNSEYCYPKYEINEEYEPDSSMAWLIKTTPNGDTLWTKTYLEKSHGNCVVQTSDGGYIIVGWIFPDEQDNQSDVLLIKTDSSGDTLWTKIIGGEDYDAGFCIGQTADGYVIAGQTKPEGRPYDALLIKTNLSGEVLWSKTFGGELSDVAFTVDVSDEGYFITGSTNGTWWVSAIADMWVFETDFNGNLLWERIYDIRFGDIGFSGIQSSDGGYVITGMTSHGFGGDLWLAKLGREPIGVKDNPSTVTDYVLHQNYPNPFNPSTKIKYSIPVGDAKFASLTNNFVTLKVFDILGREVAALVNKVQEPGTYEVQFNAGSLSSGIYFYKLEVYAPGRAGKFIAIKKLMLMK